VTGTDSRDFLTHLECHLCGGRHEADAPQTVCRRCRGSLLARYDLGRLRAEHGAAWVDGSETGLWRYHRLLPVRGEENRLRLGEGGVPLTRPGPLNEHLGTDALWVQDESWNATGSFKARGLCVAVSRAKELGIRELAVPSAGNAAGALAAYAARAGIRATVAMPRDVSRVFPLECRAYGAGVLLVDGHIGEAARALREAVPEAFFLNTLQEPYRLEGKKTMGFELWEKLGRLPDVIVYPTGGGTGLVGMPKAFDELEALGLTGSERPRMVAVQTEGCAPVVKALREGAETIEAWPDPRTFASGLCVPRPYADREVLRILRETSGTAVAVSEVEIVDATFEMGRLAGIFPAPEGAATLAACRRLLRSGWLGAGELIVLFNTGSGLKYAGVFPAGGPPRGGTDPGP
jgi:threonine synthase